MSSPNENHEISNVTDSLPGKLTKKLNKANKQVTTLKKKLKVSQQKSRRLKKKVKSLKDVTKELSDKNLITSKLSRNVGEQLFWCSICTTEKNSSVASPTI